MESDDILRESYAIGGHALSLFIARNGQHLHNGHNCRPCFCQLTDLREIWHAHHAIQGNYTPPSNFLILDHQYHWGDPDVDGRIILRGIFRKWEGVVGTGCSGLRIGTGGGHL
jgi:hypothetical protein